MNVLSLLDPAVYQVRRHHPLLRHAKVIGRGSFCAVFAAPDASKVFKLTADNAHHDYLVDGCSPDGAFKPVVFVDHEEVGETSDGVPFFLLEVEMLRKLERGTDNNRLAQRIIAHVAKHKRFPEFASALAGLNDAMFEFMERLNWFVDNFGYAIDAKLNNFMQRHDGTLVFSDPVYNRKVYEDKGRHRFS